MFKKQENLPDAHTPERQRDPYLESIFREIGKGKLKTVAKKR